MPERYLEASEILMESMRGGALSYQGHHFQLDNVPLTLRPHQRPHPPIWVATNRPESARWAAANGANIASMGPAPFVRKTTDAYRAEKGYSTGTDGQPSFVGLLRMIVVGQSASHAYSLAAPAFERWLKNFKYLYDLNAIPLPPNLPLTLDAAVESELCVVGTAALVRRNLLDQLEEAGANYLLCQVAFGDLPLDASLCTAMTIASELMGRAA